jgi:hypothetical protein
VGVLGYDVVDEMTAYKADSAGYWYCFEIFSFHGAKTNGCEAIRVFSKMRDAKQVAEILGAFR